MAYYNIYDQNYVRLAKNEAKIVLSKIEVLDHSEYVLYEITDDIIRADLDAVIKIAPDFVYAYYNRGNLFASLNDYRSALADYSKALELNPSFGEAYYNRGLTQIYLGNNKQGVSDLSKAGELGIVSSYNILKRFTDNR